MDCIWLYVKKGQMLQQAYIILIFWLKAPEKPMGIE